MLKWTQGDVISEIQGKHFSNNMFLFQVRTLQLFFIITFPRWDIEIKGFYWCVVTLWESYISCFHVNGWVFCSSSSTSALITRSHGGKGHHKWASDFVSPCEWVGFTLPYTALFLYMVMETPGRPSHTAPLWVHRLVEAGQTFPQESSLGQSSLGKPWSGKVGQLTPAWRSNTFTTVNPTVPFAMNWIIATFMRSNTVCDQCDWIARVKMKNCSYNKLQNHLQVLQVLQETTKYSQPFYNLTLISSLFFPK